MVPNWAKAFLAVASAVPAGRTGSKEFSDQAQTIGDPKGRPVHGGRPCLPALEGCRGAVPGIIEYPKK